MRLALVTIARGTLACVLALVYGLAHAALPPTVA